MSSAASTMDTLAHLAVTLAGLRLSTEAVVRRNEPLAPHTTLRVGGPADLYVQPATEDDLRSALKFCRDGGLPWFVLGRGSNLLVKDRGFRGMVLCLSHPHFSRTEVRDVQLVCAAGARLK